MGYGHAGQAFTLAFLASLRELTFTVFMTKPDFSRREFLTLAGLLALAPALRYLPAAQPAAQGERPNIIVIINDALCAFHLNTYGYPRNTSPNLDRFAAHATVFHNHHSAGNFTTPSTASLFTGLYPWTHRAFNLNSLVVPAERPHNLFAPLHEQYHIAAFTQNVFVDTLLYQFEEYIASHPGLDSFSRAGHTFYNHLFPNDAIYGMKGYDQLLFKREEAHGSLLASLLNDLAVQANQRLQSQSVTDLYPAGLPRLANTDVYYMLGEVMAGVTGLLTNLPQPNFTYIHLLPPHAPYAPARAYQALFDDGWSPPPKKKHRLAAGVAQPRLDAQRRTYDQFIANIDDEFGRLLQTIENAGLLENSYIFYTSDHGEIFERGAAGHSMPLLFEPNIRVPLFVHAPGQQQRQDVHALTSNVDLLPTFLYLAGLPPAEWAAGRALPGLGGAENAPERDVFVVEAKANAAQQPLRKASLALIRWPYKLVHYLGYRYYSDNYELYDLQNDPEELQNLYPDHPMAAELQAELDAAAAEADKPYVALTPNPSPGGGGESAPPPPSGEGAGG